MAFGAAVAVPDKRMILITGEGSHQLTVQEISQFGRLGLKAHSICAQPFWLSYRAVVVQRSSQCI